MRFFCFQISIYEKSPGRLPSFMCFGPQSHLNLPVLPSKVYIGGFNPLKVYIGGFNPPKVYIGGFNPPKVYIGGFNLPKTQNKTRVGKIYNFQLNILSRSN